METEDQRFPRLSRAETNFLRSIYETGFAPKRFDWRTDAHLKIANLCEFRESTGKHHLTPAGKALIKHILGE